MVGSDASGSIRERSDRIARHIDRARLLAIAERLISVPSPTGNAGGALDALAEFLTGEGIAVERPQADHPKAPAVVARLSAGAAGKTLQFDGHLDTVHLPFVPFGREGETITGSGSCDMKGGTAAAVEAMLAARDSGVLGGGSILLTAHDLHEAPWGFGTQFDRLISDGVVGDAVLIPEPLSGHLPVAGRGQACWKVTIRRDGPPVHEVMRPEGAPRVIAVGAELIRRLGELDARVAAEVDPVAGRSSAFVGQVHAGELYNQDPPTCWIEGTRRWVPGKDRHAIEAEFRSLLDELAAETGTAIEAEYQLVRDAFALNLEAQAVADFRLAYESIAGSPLPTGPKPFVDDGNSVWALAGVPAITHGPRSGGQHTTGEWASVDDLVRVAHTYALTAALFCPRGS
ncbi:M20 family metallopeptidase [Tautonia sociabilis]|uniref:M20 family peptidase n=1 Tax=Tautonia sociabilis TaxID=2080755 RepID=A0A432MEL1_9BACT|nr:M20/M25/M40 family metallo-hydrolase [Tautonia sociabilis]RUL83957.1 M20 family peptidase [Tautonia sociabilis]